MKSNGDTLIIYLIIFVLISVPLGLYFIMHAKSEKKVFSIRDLVFKRPNTLYSKDGVTDLPMWVLDYSDDLLNKFRGI